MATAVDVKAFLNQVALGLKTYGATQRWKRDYDALVAELFQVLQEEYKEKTGSPFWSDDIYGFLTMVHHQYPLPSKSEEVFLRLKAFVKKNKLEHTSPIL